MKDTTINMRIRADVRAALDTKLERDGYSSRTEWINEQIRNYLKEDNKMSIDYGTVKFEGNEYRLTSQADFTNRLFNHMSNFNQVDDGEEFEFEMSARAIDNKGDKYTVYWRFTDVKGEQKELDEFDYSIADRVKEM